MGDRGKHGNHVRGRKHYRWNRGPLMDQHGYRLTRVGRSHPLADPNGYAREHVVIWCAAGNPRPRRNECLHHKNGDRTDNRLQNLELMPRDKHSGTHLATRQRDALGRLLPKGRS